MRKIYLLFLLLLITKTTWSQSSYTTTFSLTENPLSDGNRWLNGKTNGLDWANVKISNGNAIGTQTNGGYNDSTAVLQGTWPADQTVQATVYSANPNSNYYPEVELLLRHTITPHKITGYEINYSMLGSYVQIVRWEGPINQFTYLASGGLSRALRTGDVVKATIVGNKITAYWNNIQVAQATDNKFTNGSPGIGFFHFSSGDGQDYKWGFTDFTAVGAGTVPPPVCQ